MTSPATDGWHVLGQWLRYLRESAGVTQDALAQEIRYSRTRVTKAENHGEGARDLFALAGEVLGAGDELGRMHDLIATSTRAMVVVVPGLPRAQLSGLRVPLRLPEYAYAADLLVPLLLLPAPPGDAELRITRTMCRFHGTCS